MSSNNISPIFLATATQSPKKTTTTPRLSLEATSRSSSVGSKAWHSIKKAAKNHHDSVNSAYSTYYAPGVSPIFLATQSTKSTPKSTPRPSLELASPRSSIESVRGEEEVGAKGGAWGKVKKAAKQHHRSVNSAVGTYYGAGHA